MGLAPTGKRRLCTAHANSRHRGSSRKGKISAARRSHFHAITRSGLRGCGRFFDCRTQLRNASILSAGCGLNFSAFPEVTFHTWSFSRRSSKSAIVGLGFADQRRQALAQVGRQTSCRSHDRPCRHRLGRCPCAFRHHSQPGGDFFAKMLLSGGPHRSTRAELPMSPEISPKEICQTVFG